MSDQDFDGYDIEDHDEYGNNNDIEINLPKASKGKETGNIEPNRLLVSQRMNEILSILSNLKELREGERSRESYTDELIECMSSYYDTNKELVEIFLHQFGPQEAIQFMEANEQERPVVIRTNTLKTRRKELAQVMIQRGVNLDALAEWSKVGLNIFESKVPIGATPEYLAGHYMLQSASSFLPVIALAPKPDEKVLDMAAAPGGKTTYIAQLMKNTGVLVANDLKKERLIALKYNVQRMGITNTIVTCYDGKKMPDIQKNFDRVLLDAPCTGLGIISRDPSIKATKGLRDILKHAHLQKELLNAAIDCAKVGGYIVYSTCSISPLEDEWVVDYALKSRYVKLVDTSLDIGSLGLTKYEDKRFNQTLKKCRRVFPHIHNMDGFFLAKLKKTQDGPRKEADAENMKKLKEVQKAKKERKREKIQSRLDKKAKLKVSRGEEIDETKPISDESKLKKSKKIAKENKKISN